MIADSLMPQILSLDIICDRSYIKVVSVKHTNTTTSRGQGGVLCQSGITNTLSFERVVDIFKFLSFIWPEPMFSDDDNVMATICQMMEVRMAQLYLGPCNSR